MRLAALLLFLSISLSAQQASIAGVAINAVTKQPLDGVHITLSAVRPNAISIETYGATSDKDGHFSIPNVQPAIYSLSARHNAYVYMQEDEKPPPERRLTLNPGEAITDHTVEMTPSAVIAGRVVDGDGDPVENAFVHAVPVGGNSPISLVVDRMSGPTNERGEFRIVGAPGKFYVSATKAGAPIGLREIRSDGSEIPVYVQTWYPESESQARAALVEAVAGRETAGIDIRLARKRSLTISGVVTGTPEGTARAQVFARTKSLGMQPATPDPDGKFAFSGLAPDRYWVTARYEAASQQLISGTAEVPLENADDNSLTLRLDPGKEVSGNLEIEGEPSNSAPAQKRTILLESVTPVNYVPFKGGEVDSAGNFTISPVYPDRFRVRVDPLPENAFIRTIRLDGAALPDTVIDLSRGVEGSKLKITIGLNGGRVEGTVSSDTGKPVCCAMVVLAAAIEDIGNDTIKAVAGGEKYRFTGLRPGKYRLIVAGPTQVFGTQTAEALFPAAPEIEVHEGDRITKDVTFKERGNSRENP